MAGNMYEDVKTGLNALRGRCKIACIYCSTITLRETYPGCNNKYNGPYELDKAVMSKNWGEGHTYFLCSQSDLFAKGVPDDIIETILEKTNKHPDNIYMLQSKNPARILDFWEDLPFSCQLGTTIETNRDELILSSAPKYSERARAMIKIKESISIGIGNEKKETYCTIEPIVDFDLEPFVELLFNCCFDKIYIGADSKGHDLPEPTKEKIGELIKELKAFTTVVVKDNLGRIYP